VAKLSAKLTELTTKMSRRIGPSYPQSNAAMEVIQSQAVQIDELRAALETINDEYLSLRTSQTERITKVENCFKDRGTLARSESLRLTEAISNLGVSLTQK
jgi:hypothetical protein